jgi:hypothetical protein
MKKLILLGCVISLLSACASTPVTLGQGAAVPYNTARGRIVEGSSCGMQLLYLIPIGLNNRLENAYAEVQTKAGNDVIVDVYVRDSWWYAVLGNFYCTEIRAMVYPRKKAS